VSRRRFLQVAGAGVAGGALPKLDALSVYVTGFTPFRATLRIA
jgi:hypothetical protein